MLGREEMVVEGIEHTSSGSDSPNLDKKASRIEETAPPEVK